MPPFTQADRWLQIRFAGIDADRLVLETFRGREAVSEPFRYSLELIADTSLALRPDDLLGRPASVRLAYLNQPERWFNGIVAAIEQDAPGRDVTRFRATLEPKAALLKRTRRSRVFQDMTVRNILEIVLRDVAVEWRLTGAYPKHDFCMQYEESDLTFVHRLMEEEGIYYRFEHSDADHRMIIGDQSKTVSAPPQSIQIRAVEGAEDEPAIRSWTIRRELRSEECLLHDHSFQLTGSAIEARSPVLGPTGVSTPSGPKWTDPLQIYDHRPLLAHRFDDIGVRGADQNERLKELHQDLSRLVVVSAQREAIGSDLVEGKSDVIQFAAGSGQNVIGTDGVAGSYFVLEVEHEASQPVLTGSDLDSSRRKYSNRFRMQPASLPYRPPVRHPMPAIGPQSAVVVGVSESDPVFTDKYGRVKVQFHWDRAGKRNANSSCWLRVLQPLAGDHFGMLTLPRVGQEVIVDFLDGDPDCPFVAGSVYNSTHMPPFDLPFERYRTGLKSQTINGAPDEFSGLQFDDSKNGEILSLHAKRDGLSNYRRDHVENVGRYSHANYGCSRIEMIGGLPLLSSNTGESPRTHDDIDNPSVLDWMTGGSGSTNSDSSPGSGAGGAIGAGGGKDGKGGIYGGDWTGFSVRDAFGMDCRFVLGSASRFRIGPANSIEFGPQQTHSFNLGGFAALDSIENLIKKPPYSALATCLGAAQGLAGGATSIIAGSKYELIYGAAVSGLCGPKVDWIMDHKTESLAKCCRTLLIADAVLSASVSVALLLGVHRHANIPDKEVVFQWGFLGLSYLAGIVATAFVQSGALLAEGKTKAKEAQEVVELLSRFVTADMKIQTLFAPLVESAQARIANITTLIAEVSAKEGAGVPLDKQQLPKSHKYQTNGSDYTLSAYNLKLVAIPKTPDNPLDEPAASSVDVAALGKKGSAFLRGGKAAVVQSGHAAVACSVVNPDGTTDVLIDTSSLLGKVSIAHHVLPAPPNSTIQLSRKGVVIEASPQGSIELRVGASYLKISATGVELHGATTAILSAPDVGLDATQMILESKLLSMDAPSYELTAKSIKENGLVRGVNN